MAVPRFKVRYQDGRELEVRVMPKAQVMFETHFNTTMSVVATNPSATQGYYLAWAALHCAGMEGREFDPFIEAIEEVIPQQPEETPDPTQTAPSPEPSSP